MTDTAKPTLGKGCTVKLWDRASFRYFVSDEAVDVYHETNLTPRQLLERVRELEELVEDLLPYAKAAVPFPVAVGEPTVFERAEAALAKHGEVV